MTRKGAIGALSAAIMVAGLTPAAVANAGVLYDNLSAPPAGADSVMQIGPLYASFSTGSNNTLLTQVDLLMYATDPSDGGSFQVGLYADNGTTPGALIASWSANDSTLSTSPTVEDFLASSPIALSAGTRYWIGLSSSFDLFFSVAADTSGIGVANEFYFNQEGLSPNSDGPYMMRVAVTPEPATWALLFLGFIGISVTAMRHSRRLAA